MRANEFAELAAFIAIAEERSFRRAAERLNLTASTLSHSLRSLEARLGVSLVNRTTRTVSPTEAGSALLAQVAPAFSSIDTAVESINAFRSCPQGRVKINVPILPAEILLAPRLARFHRLYPDIVLEITVDNRFVDIVRDGYDAGIRLGESVQQDMVAVRMTGDLRAAIVGSPDYFARHAAPRTPHELQQHLCINRRYGANGPLYRWEFEKDGKSLTVQVDGPLVLDQDTLMIRAALDGVGLACVAEIDVAEPVKDGRLVRVLEDWCPPFGGFFLYYPRHRQGSASLRALIEVLRAPV